MKTVQFTRRRVIFESIVVEIDDGLLETSFDNIVDLLDYSDSKSWSCDIEDSNTTLDGECSDKYVSYEINVDDDSDNRRFYTKLGSLVLREKENP